MDKGKRGRNAALLRVLRLYQRLSGLRYAPTVAVLAGEFSVTTRTIRRDLNLLEEAGFAVPRWRDELGQTWKQGRAVSALGKPVDVSPQIGSAL